MGVCYIIDKSYYLKQRLRHMLNQKKVYLLAILYCCVLKRLESNSVFLYVRKDGLLASGMLS